MMPRGKIFWLFVALACLVLVGTLLWSHNSVASLSGGALSAYLASLAKKARDKELQALRDQNAQTQREGQEALHAADEALQKMEDASGRVLDSGEFSTPDTLTAKGNDLFKQGNF